MGADSTSNVLALQPKMQLGMSTNVPFVWQSIIELKEYASKMYELVWYVVLYIIAYITIYVYNLLSSADSITHFSEVFIGELPSMLVFSIGSVDYVNVHI